MSFDTQDRPSSLVRGTSMLAAALLIAIGWVNLAAAQDDTLTASAAGLTVSDIRDVMGANRLEVRDCVTGEGLPVRVDIVVDFVIGLDGNVDRASLLESNAGERVDRCVLDVFQTLAFPSPTDGTFAVRYPMIFVTGG